jgi:antitoxin (DNA-binding transcriptional repressor) of toxin-antitoxin stability system
MVGAQSQRRVEATRLPQDIVVMIDALLPGENILITLDGEPIATVSSTRDKFRTRGSLDAERAPSVHENMTVVATAMKLSASARASLSEQLGPDYLVLDMNAAPESVDVLLIPPLSPQLIGILRSKFPQARVVIAEIEDRELGISYDGPLRRLFDAGADTYFPSSTIPQLAAQLDRTMAHLNQISGGTSPALVIESPQDRTAFEGD